MSTSHNMGMGNVPHYFKGAPNSQWRPKNINQIAGSGGEDCRMPMVQGKSQGEQRGQALRREARSMQQPSRTFVLPVVKLGRHGAATAVTAAGALRSLRLL